MPQFCRQVEGWTFHLLGVSLKKNICSLILSPALSKYLNALSNMCKCSFWVLL